jgi:hypothetical protein
MVRHAAGQILNLTLTRNREHGARGAFGGEMRRLALTAAAVLLPCMATAGAWPREEGEVFLSFGANVLLSAAAERPVHYDPTVYLAYGLTERWTVGLDGYTADKGAAGSLFVFTQTPIGPTDGPNRFALSFALGGVRIPTGEVEPSLRFGAHYGRGLESGWIALDAFVVHAVGVNRQQTKLDATWGWRFADDWATVLRGEIGTGLEGDLYAKIAPSILYEVTDHVTARVGVTQALTGDEGAGLHMEVWFRF